LKQYLRNLFQDAFLQLKAQGVVPPELHPTVQIERTRDSKHGDFACNLAMMLAKPARMKPRDLAEKLLEALPRSELIAKAEIAGPGFINIFLAPQAYHAVVEQILTQQTAFGRSQLGAGQKVLLEFVSANPTGPLHVGHGRGAAYEAALGDLLAFAGYQVHREYYVNDAGRQMDILATSVWLRYLEVCGDSLVFPQNAYKGDYIWAIARQLHAEQGDRFRQPVEAVYQAIPPDEPEGGDKEAHIDALIARAKALLGTEAYEQVFNAGLNEILADIRADLEAFGVQYQNWFSERSLTTQNLISHAIESLTQREYIYTQDKALWFRSEAFGDEKDRVVVRDNGQHTYFAADIAYHLNKIERGFDIFINIWGADHHGYVARVKAAMAAFGINPDCLKVLLVQFATLYRGQERLQMSTRSGEFVTLRELREEVGTDAARFFYIQRRTEQHLEFDLELAKSQSKDNPVYYIQYAHARIASVFRQLAETQVNWQATNANLRYLALLTTAHERHLLMTLSRYPEVIETAAQAYEPHQVANYLRDLAQAFHAYYDAGNTDASIRVLVEDTALREARLSLVAATQQVLANGLHLIGVSAPELM